MTDAFRALCAELTFCWSRTTNPDDFTENVAPIVERMKAALAQPEPEFTAEEVEMIQAPWSYLAPVQPEPVGPTDDQIDALVICIQALPIPDADDLALSSIDRGREMVRQALARWGHQPPQPIPVSERLPPPECPPLTVAEALRNIAAEAMARRRARGIADNMLGPEDILLFSGEPSGFAKQAIWLTDEKLNELMHDFVLGGESPEDFSFDHLGYAKAVMQECGITEP